MTQIEESVNARRSDSGWGVHVVCFLVVFVPLIVFLSPVIAFLLNPFGGTDEPVAITPADGFSQLTGWQLPDNVSIVKNINSHSGFKNDGDYTLIVSMSPTQLRGLLEHDSNTWTDCPVAPEIAQSAWSLPSHSGTMYYAKKTSDSDSDWHRGHVVIVNSETGMVWVYEWKI